MNAETQPENSIANELDNYPVVAEGGIKIPVSPSNDPYAQLDDLMKVVEALCSTWPERGMFKEGGIWLL